MAWVVDKSTGDVLSQIRPLDKTKNADGRRRSLEPLDNLPDPPASADSDPIPPLMRKYLEEYAATGAPVAYLPKDEHKLTDNLESQENCDD